MANSELMKSGLEGFAGKASLYRLSEPLSYGDAKIGDDGATEYVVASTADVMFSGIETYLFPADAQGVIVNWIELPGSMKGTSSHSKVLNAAGYPLRELA